MTMGEMPEKLDMTGFAVIYLLDNEMRLELRKKL